MDVTPRDETAPEALDGSPAASGEAGSPGGLEINLGDFTRAQGLMKSLRLTLNNQVVVQVEELASGISDAGRKFKMGEIEQANLDVARLYASFGQRTNQWDSQARNLEQQMKMEAAKNPKSISIEKMNRMKAEQTAVRTRIRTAEVQFRRLHQGLDLAFSNLQRQPALQTATAVSQPLLERPPVELPPGFLAAFQAAALDDRPGIIQQHFKIEAILSVAVSRGTKTGYEIRFAPKPPLERLYYLCGTAQLVWLQRLDHRVRLLDVETCDAVEWKLVEFVKLVHSGAWLLAPRS